MERTAKPPSPGAVFAAASRELPVTLDPGPARRTAREKEQAAGAASQKSEHQETSQGALTCHRILVET